MFTGFVSGLNTIDSPYTLQETESPDCLNVVATTRGAIRKRTGSTLFTSGTLPSAVTDNFNRANESPLSNAGAWATITGAAGTGEVKAEEWCLGPAYPTAEGARWTVAEQANPAVLLDIVNLPGLVGRYFGVWCCLATGAKTGYFLRCEETSSAEKLFTVTLEKWTAGTRVILATLEKQSLVAGDSIAITANSGTVTGWRKHAGTWAQLLSAPDATYTTGHTGMEASGNNGRYDNFTIGEYGVLPGIELHSIFPVTINSTKWLIAAGGGKIYSISAAGVITQIGSGFNATTHWSIVQAPTSVGVAGEGPVYMVNGVDAPQYWTGAGEVKPWTGKNDAEHYAVEPHVPKGKWMIFAGNRIWMTGVEGDPSAVWFSDIVSTGETGGQGDPSSWPKTNVVRFDSSDGQAITGIGTVGPYIVVFKERKAWVINDLNTGANRRLADTIGCVSHRSIVETAMGTLFLTADQGVYLTDGSHLKEMSYSVRPTILGITSSERQNAAGAYFNNHYYLSFATNGSASNNRTLDYDVQLKSWWLHDLAANQWALWEPGGDTNLYACSPGVSKGVVQAFVPGIYTDVGANYTGANGLSAYWLSAWQVFWIFINRHRIPVPDIKKRVRQLHFDGSGEIIPIIAKNFSTVGTYVPGVVGSDSEDFPAKLVDFSEGDPTFGNENEAQEFGGESLEGQQMIFGGAATTRDARLYSLGLARAWQVGFGNNTSAPFEVDSFTFAIQFRKS